MDSIILKNDKGFPPLLREINDPPEKLFVRGNIDKLLDENMKILCVVGARKYSSYGKDVIERLINGLRGYNICIVSGLALGIDGIAHRSALQNGLYTVSFPGSGLDPSVLYPRSNIGLADEIVNSGGALLSELEPKMMSAHWTFPRRNRLMAGIAHATIVVEAKLKSGTLITSKYATDYNRDVGAVLGSILSPLSEGPHMLIRLGATPITCSDDILELLGFTKNVNVKKIEDKNYDSLGKDEKKIMDILTLEPKDKDFFVHELHLDTRHVNTLISSLEIEGYVKEEMGMVRVV